jgi:hypothetical protein
MEIISFLYWLKLLVSGKLRNNFVLFISFTIIFFAKIIYITYIVLFMSTWKNFISNRGWFSLTSFFSSWKKQDSWKEMWDEDIISKAITEVDKKYEKPISISLTRKPDSTSVSYSAGNVNAKSGGLLLMRQPKSKPSMSDAAVLLKKNEWSLILWRKGLLTDEQVSLIAWSSEKVLDLSLFELTDHQLEILARYCWDEIIFWLKRLTDRQSEIFSRYNVWTLNLCNLLRISDYQLEQLTKLRRKKLNLRDLVPSRVQKTMLSRYQWKIINRVYSQREEMNRKIIEQQRELKRQREERRKVRSVAYTSFQYA